MSTDGRFMDQYELYIRRGDGAMRLVERDSRKPVHIEAYFHASRSNGVFVRPRGLTGIYLMEDEIVVVDEFPASQCSLNGKAASPRKRA